MKEDFLPYCSKVPFDYRRALGNMDAAAGINRYKSDDGPSCGMRIAEVYTAAGLRYSVLLDRGMDIGMTSFRGIPMAFYAKNGLVRADYAMTNPNSFPYYFTAGLLSTCGLDNVGQQCESDGKVLPTHGTRTFLPAYEVCGTSETEKGEQVLRVKGKMRIAPIFGENILLVRELVSKAESSSIEIIDSIENQGSLPYEYMILYHINFGFPLVSPDSKVHTNHEEVRFFTKPGMQERPIPEPDLYRKFVPPQKTFSEYVFEMRKVRDNTVNAEVENPILGVKAIVNCESKNLPCFTQWINLAEQDYVLGLEPGTHNPLGRRAAKENGGLVLLAPGETKTHSVRITFETL